MEKIVFSRTLKEATWNNSRILASGLLDEVRDLKKVDGKPITILGSGSIVSQLAEAGLIDEYQVVVNPLVTGKGPRRCVAAINGQKFASEAKRGKIGCSGA